MCWPCCTEGARLTYYGQILSHKENATKKFAVKVPLISRFKLNSVLDYCAEKFMNDLTWIQRVRSRQKSYSKIITFGISVF